MKKYIYAFVLLVMVAMTATGFTAKSQAASSRWIAGTPYYVDELVAGDVLEHRYDSAFCDGITRFGRIGSYPYEKYRVFDCDIFDDRVACTTWRMATVKSRIAPRWHFVVLRKTDCF